MYFRGNNNNIRSVTASGWLPAWR